MENISEIQNKLQRGDRARIARITGFSEVYVGQVLSGDRKNERVKYAAYLLITHQEMSEQVIKTQLKDKFDRPVNA